MTAPVQSARGPRASVSSSALGRNTAQEAAPSSLPLSRRQSQDSEADTMSAAAVPLPSGRPSSQSGNSIPDAVPGKGDVPLPSARRASAAASKGRAAQPSARRSAQADPSAPLPSARRGTRDVSSSSGNSAAAGT